MKKLLPLFILIFAVQISAQKPATATKKTAPASATVNLAGKIGQFVAKETGYTKFADNVWSIPFNGNSLARFEVVVTSDKETDLVLMYVNIAKNKELRLSQDLLYSILKFNGVADKVKGGIDEGGDLFLRTEVSGRLLDIKEFKALLEQVAAASDKLHGQIKNSIVSAP